MQNKISSPLKTETEQVVDFRNIESLISKQSDVDVSTAKSEILEPFSEATPFYPKTLVVENDDLEERIESGVSNIRG